MMITMITTTGMTIIEVAGVAIITRVEVVTTIRAAVVVIVIPVVATEVEAEVEVGKEVMIEVMIVVAESKNMKATIHARMRHLTIQ